MIDRCTNKNAANYYRYGGRGVTICERWLRFENFLQDMGERPGETTLNRIHNERGYESGNCNWASIEEQTANRFNVGRPKRVR